MDSEGKMEDDISATNFEEEIKRIMKKSYVGRIVMIEPYKHIIIKVVKNDKNSPLLSLMKTFGIKTLRCYYNSNFRIGQFIRFNININQTKGYIRISNECIRLAETDENGMSTIKVLRR